MTDGGIRKQHHPKNAPDFRRTYLKTFHVVRIRREVEFWRDEEANARQDAASLRNTLRYQQDQAEAVLRHTAQVRGRAGGGAVALSWGGFYQTEC